MKVRATVSGNVLGKFQISVLMEIIQIERLRVRIHWQIRL